MCSNIKYRSASHQATVQTTNSTNDLTSFSSHVKALIVTLAMREVLSKNIAYWLINLGGLRDE